MGDLGLGDVEVTADDIAQGWRTLSVAAEVAVEALLQRAAPILRSQSPGLLDRLTAGTTPAEAVEQVLIQAVRRALPLGDLNPDGAKVVSRSVDDYSERFEWDVDTLVGELYFTDRELASIAGGNGRRGKAFTINTMPGPRY